MSCLDLTSSEIMQLISVIVALILGLMGIFQENIKSIFIHSKLVPSFEKKHPYVLSEGPYYLRLAIHNYGNGVAENVSVFASKLVHESGSPIEDFVPFPLIWEPTGHWNYTINPDELGYVGLIEINNHRRLFSVSISGISNALPERGVYFLLFTISSKNNRPQEWKMKIKIEDIKPDSSQPRMKEFYDAINISEPKKI